MLAGQIIPDLIKDTCLPKDLMRNKRTVWSICPKGTSDNHFAVFPDELVELMMNAGCKPGGIVLDMFSGSGTTCKIAKKLGFNYLGFDINQEYVELAKKKISKQPIIYKLDI